MVFNPYEAYAKRKMADVGVTQSAPTTNTRNDGRIRATPSGPTPSIVSYGMAGAAIGAASPPTTPTPAPVTAPPTVTQPPPAPVVRPEVKPLPKIADTEQPMDKTSGVGDRLTGFTEADITASLAAIEAEYGLTREELLRDQSYIGAQYRLLTAQLARQRQLALEGAEAGALQRGLFRSGIFAEEAGKVQQSFADAQAQMAQETLAEEGQILSQLETLDAERGNAQAQEETRIRRKEYEARLAAAGL